ncbi:hypothetical protein TWF103_009451 [Orbilia oligospora]|uniref:DUF7932 domain-containing protein n=2 Tax=Orbilia oligospora TaxID=2813651 RepID=A0A7C8NRR6_ORBOL|nr:hypothetical protein TWF103_009451 [Orbilia oligospora]KAF3137928.1 hypothetical protein TWF703_004899 [Orbilia oligospora]
MERKNYYPGTDSLYHGLVDASGIDGGHGSSGMTGMPGGSGAPGSPGTNATQATHGGNAREMKVKLSRRIYHDAAARIEAHCLTPSNTPSRQEWLLQAQDMILLQAKGGDGGNGGHGGNGGDGGRGMDGVSSNEYQSGTRGGSGGAGGNGGNGTSGGNGGSGAYIEIEVEEDDMDLLIPIHWDVRGGIGGNAGTNGFGGRGGRPGHGGKGSGSHGIDGADGNAILIAGQHGQPGNARIQVHMKSTRELGARHNFYTSRYFFTLVDFDIVDENEDGIFEPGEHIYIQNIRIQNTGGMPTPSQAIPIHVVASAWFEVYEGETAFIPPSIPEWGVVTIKDRLRARIKYPPEPWGRAFRETTQIEFHAALPNLNGRIIRDFSGKRDVVLSYPISVESIRWANSVLPNTKMSMVWVITNKSTRALGRSSEQARNVEYIFRGNRDLSTETDLTMTNGTNLERMVEIDYLAPGDTRTYTQEVVVHSSAETYKHHNFDLVLYLGRPRSTQRDVVQVGNLRVQIASPFVYQPTASFLLIVNCETTKQQIVAQHQLFSSLNVVYDTWNVSLYGGFNRPTDGLNVLNNYFGKGLVLFGEDFDFFQQNGTRNAADMIPPDLGFTLANHGTNILFIGKPSPSIDAWAKAVTFPQFGVDPLPFKTKKEVVVGLRAAGLHNQGASVPISASRLSRTKGNFEKRAAKTSKLLKTKFPLERFQIYPSLQDVNVVIVRQSLPVANRLMICSGPSHNADAFDSLHLIAVVSSLPIAMRMQVLFAMTAPGLMVMKAGETSSVTDLLVPQAIKLSIIHELELEIARYHYKAPWPHRIETANTANFHLKSFHAFIGAWPWEPLDQDRTNLIMEIFAHILRAVKLSGFGEIVIRFGFRKTNMRNYLLAKIKDFLTARTPNGLELVKQLTVQAGDDKRFVKIADKITTALQVPAADLATRWVDSFHEESKVLNAEEYTASQAQFTSRANRLNTDNGAAQYILRELVNPYPGIIIPPSS